MMSNYVYTIALPWSASRWRCWQRGLHRCSGAV